MAGGRQGRAAAAEAAGLEAEVVELARALIRIDTSNPPGRETPAAELLAEYLRKSGVESELVGPDPERLNLVARVKGRGAGPSLLLLAHTDVVPAPSTGWTVPPFAGELRSGSVIGRGAGDMKGELAARAVALAALARRDDPPEGDVVLIAESDEECNASDVGMSWLVRERPDLRCDYALNEGGGLLLELADGRRVVLISVGEKILTSVRIRVFGQAAHASVPPDATNAVRQAASAVELLYAYRPAAVEVASVERALGVLGAPPGGSVDEAAAWAGRLHPLLAEMLPVTSRMTVTPTGLRTHEPANVIPPWADVVCDCRALPGQTEADVREHVDAALGGSVGYELELLEPMQGGTESPIDTPLYRFCQEYLDSRLPGAELLPLVTPGFTDSDWVRRAHGTVAYGFAPVFSTDPAGYLSGMHGADEALDVADLVEMTEFHLRAASAGLGPAT